MKIGSASVVAARRSAGPSQEQRSRILADGGAVGDCLAAIAGAGIMRTRMWATSDQLTVSARNDDARSVVICLGEVLDLFIDVDAAQRLSNDLQDAVDELDGLAQP